MLKKEYKEREIRTRPLRDTDQHEWKVVTKYCLIRKKDRKTEKDNPNASTTAVVDTGDDHNKLQDAVGHAKKTEITTGSVRDKLVENVTLIAAGAKLNNPSAYQPGKWKETVRAKKGTKSKDPSSEWVMPTFCGMRIKFKPKQNHPQPGATTGHPLGRI